jgi:hypothetical protein
MRSRLSLLALLALTLLGAAGAHADPKQFTFSYQFEPGERMQPRGGTTKGAPVKLATEPSAEWRALQAPNLDVFERDRRAILAMTGGFRTTFDFIETVGFAPGFEPARPYQSWGTEYVYVIEDRRDFISLQHLLVMFVTDAAGKVQGPFVQKHWRQDWQYEDTDLHVFAGRDRWRRERPDAAAARGRWSQAVYQVDDSPRYEALGTWVHEGSYSAWTSDQTWRPLPRRESSVRDDYQVLAGINRHTITPTGWVQEEENLKLVLGADGRPAANAPYLSRELGVNRYERVADFDFSAGDRYWQHTSDFWRDVRDAWKRVYAERDAFEYAQEVDGHAMFEPLFEYAEGLDTGGKYDARAAADVIRRTFSTYLR